MSKILQGRLAARRLSLKQENVSSNLTPATLSLYSSVVEHWLCNPATRVRFSLGALVAVVLLLIAAPATARQFDRTKEAVKVANRVWNFPCQGKVLTKLGSFKESTAYGFAYFEAGYTNCVVILNEIYFKKGQSSYEVFCTVILHEYGHLAGVKHSSNMKSIMYPTYRGVDKRCVKPRNAVIK